MNILFDFVRNSAAFWGGAIFVCMTAGAATAASPDSDLDQRLEEADVVVLGEVHDNPAHHQVQADILTALAPKAVVWEMITQEQADGLASISLSDAARVADHLDWATSGWPDFDYYAPVFAAAMGAQQFGGLVPRSSSKSVMEQGAAIFFGSDAAVYGLDKPLPKAEQQVREADQLTNHCNALPVEMLPMMVEFQRLRNAVLADAVVQALQATGGPIAVITGNGHARNDRGVPVYLANARPDVLVLSLGQSEAGQVAGTFDLVLDAAPVDRPDPCLAFQ